jgi:hypothetical protein
MSAENEARKHTCGNCKWWALLSDLGRMAGECHRCPPKAAAASGGSSNWPVTPSDEWCGEWSGIIPGQE